MLILLLKFTLAHLLGDFLFQSKSWVEDKQNRKIYSVYLYLHITIHFGLLLLVMGFEKIYWQGILVILTTHYIIDLLKSYSKNIISTRKAFFIDQLLHFSVIIAVSLYYESKDFSFSQLHSSKVLLLLIAILLLTSVASIIMRVVITRWESIESSSQNSLKDAGNFIGLLERILIFIFVITGHIAGVGFLLAAKSVFRFGDLSQAQDRKMTEYVLIGTLISFTMAILIGFGYSYIYKLL
ncbi:MAG: DUF3307 domain-containing protein [Reichenbachiella sp.]